MLLVYFVSVQLEKLVEKSTRQHGEILENIDQIQEQLKDFHRQFVLGKTVRLTKLRPSRSKQFDPPLYYAYVFQNSKFMKTPPRNGEESCGDFQRRRRKNLRYYDTVRGKFCPADENFRVLNK